MKKLAIAGASAVLAAMPVIGVFAESTSGSFTDNITVTVAGGCTIEVSGGTAGSYADRTFSADIPAGTAETLTGAEATSTAAPAMSVTCNVADPGQAWNITATAANGGALKDSSINKTIDSGTDTTGGTSTFAYSINNGSTWLAVPTTENAAITSGTTMSGTPTTFNPIYRVYVAPGQEPGTYAGSVTYTIHLGA